MPNAVKTKGKKQAREGFVVERPPADHQAPGTLGRGGGGDDGPSGWLARFKMRKRLESSSIETPYLTVRSELEEMA